MLKPCFPRSSVGKESAYNAGDPGSTPGSGRSPNPLQCSCLENPMDCSLPGSSVHGVARVGHDLATKPPPPPTYYRVTVWYWYKDKQIDLESKSSGINSRICTLKFMTVQNICKRKSFSNRIGSLLHITREKQVFIHTQTVHRISSGWLLFYVRKVKISTARYKEQYILFPWALYGFYSFLVLWI